MNKLYPEVFVTCLSSHNSGIVYGEWIDATQDPEDLQKAITNMLKDSPCPAAEEWKIQDHSDFGRINISADYSSLETISEIAYFLQEHGEIGAEVLNLYVSDVQEAIEFIENNYIGKYDSEKDFAMQFTEEINEIPSYLSNYIDYEKMAYEYFMHDFFSIEIEGYCHVFNYN